MLLWTQQLFAKLLIIPAVFVFAVVCCSPVAHSFSITSTQQNVSDLSANSHPLSFQDAHHCDHDKKEQIQGAAQKTVRHIHTDLMLPESSLTPESLYQIPSKDPVSIAQARITGPPWDRKNIKGFLGVFRS